MKKTLVIIMMIVITTGISYANYTTTYGADVSVIEPEDPSQINVGSGIYNGGFVVANNENAGIEVGLKAHTRFEDSLLPNNLTYDDNRPVGGAVYQGTTGVSGYTSSRYPLANWNFIYSINLTDYMTSQNLDNLQFYMSISSPGYASTDIMWTAGDQAPTNKDDMYFYQDSSNLGWWMPTYNPYDEGDYDFTLSVEDDNGVLAKSSMTVRVQAVPVPGALLLGGLGVGCVSYFRRRRSL